MTTWPAANRLSAMDTSFDGEAKSRVEREQWFGRLTTTHAAPILRLAQSYTRHARDAEDLAQDIWLAIWLALPRFRGECSERTFLFRIAHNRGLAHLARRRVPIAEPGVAVEPPDTRPSPETALAAAERHDRLLRAIRQLPLGYRQVLTLALEGLAYDEIASVLGLTETNVGARLTRARQLLRRLLEEGARGH